MADPSRTPLLPTPSVPRGELIAKLHSFFQAAQKDRTLSPREFDAWFFTLTPEDRATVHDILQPLAANWPTQVEFPNVIALVHWTRERRDEKAMRGILKEWAGLEGYNREETTQPSGEEVEAGPTMPEPEPPVPGPTCPGGVDEEPLPVPLRPEPVHGMDVLAVLVMVLAPACLVRLLVILCMLLLLRQASNGTRRL